MFQVWKIYLLTALAVGINPASDQDDLMHKWFVYDEFEEASIAAADFLAKKIEESLFNNDVCHVALPGGNSPSRCLSYLAKKKIPWQKVHWYLGDERCYPKDHVERNDVMLSKYLWSKIKYNEYTPNSNRTRCRKSR